MVRTSCWLATKRADLALWKTCWARTKQNAYYTYWYIKWTPTSFGKWVSNMLGVRLVCTRKHNMFWQIWVLCGHAQKKHNMGEYLGKTQNTEPLPEQLCQKTSRKIESAYHVNFLVMVYHFWYFLIALSLSLSLSGSHHIPRHPCTSISSLGPISQNFMWINFWVAPERWPVLTISCQAGFREIVVLWDLRRPRPRHIATSHQGDHGGGAMKLETINHLMFTQD